MRLCLALLTACFFTSVWAVDEDPSLKLRDAQRFELTTGLGVHYGLGVFANVSYRFSSAQSLGYEYSISTHFLVGNDIRTHAVRFKQNIGQFLPWLGNGQSYFFVSGALVFRQIENTPQFFSGTLPRPVREIDGMRVPDAPKKVYGKYADLGPEMIIGNEWQGDLWNFGVRLVGFFYSAKILQNSAYNGEPITPEFSVTQDELRRAESYQRDRFRRSFTNILMLYVSRKF